MAKMLFQVYDSKTKSYDMPFAAMSYGEVERIFYETVKHGKSTIAKYPNDFTIFHIGMYNEENGIITLLEAKNCVGLVSDVIKNVTQNSIQIDDEFLVPMTEEERERIENGYKGA